jgi:hypothetical protein
MGNLRNEIGLIVFNVSKNCNAINERTLIPAFNEDLDFIENEDYFREDTLDLGFENEAERVSKEIFDECVVSNYSEAELLEAMVKKLFDVDNFIGSSSYYGNYTYQIVETDFEFVVIISYIN